MWVAIFATLAALRVRVPRKQNVPMANRDRVLEAHDAAQARGDAGYLDPTSGLFVMTAARLAAVGRCCGNGCRHCPYGSRTGVPPAATADAIRPE